LPGPEAGLRWLHAAGKECPLSGYSAVPLGVSAYADDAGSAKAPVLGDLADHLDGGDRNGEGAGPPMWLSSIQNGTWVKRSLGSAGLPAWDAPSDVIVDLRAFCAQGRQQGWLQMRHSDSDTAVLPSQRRSRANSVTTARTALSETAANVEQGRVRARGWSNW